MFIRAMEYLRRFGIVTREIRKTRKNIYRWIQEGRKSGIRGDHTEPYLQKESTPTKHRLQHRTRGNH
jgi:hypothetical protein